MLERRGCGEKVILPHYTWVCKLLQPESKIVWRFLKKNNRPTINQFSSIVQSYPTLCYPMDYSSPGFPVHCQLLELALTHVHQVGDTIQPCDPLLFPSPFNLSQHQGLFQWVSYSHQVAKVLEFQLQHQSFQWIFRVDFLQDWLDWSFAVQRTLESLLEHRNSKVSILRCSALLSNPHIHTRLLEKP